LLAKIYCGKGIGPFALGVSVKDVVHFIRHHSHAFTAITRFNKEDPMSMNICIDLVKQGVELRFNSVSQRLELVRLYELTKIDLTYHGKLFSAPENVPTFLSIHSRFGPTAAGTYSDGRDMYQLHYPGITFVFKIPEQLRNADNVRDGKMPDYDNVILGCIYIFMSDDTSPHRIKPMLPFGYPNESIVVNPSQGISINTESLRFGDSPQDVLTILGPPQHVSYKTTDPLSIYRTGPKQSQFEHDYFYNYFDSGLDILFDAVAHSIKKFILHTNFPTQRNFNLYHKCHYRITPPRRDNNEREPNIEQGKEKENVVQNEENREEGEKENKEEVPKRDDGQESDGDDKYLVDIRLVTPEMKWPEIKDCYGPNVTSPFRYPRTKDNPFGGTRYYAYPDIIFEVMDNDYVSTVTLFKL